MKVAVAGGTGFVGEPLVRSLLERGDEVVVLTRNPARLRAGRPLAWDPGIAGGDWRQDVASADAVINLAGESVAGGRWTAARKERILQSRLAATNGLVDAMQARPERRRVLVSASAVGFYGPRGDDPLSEQAAAGDGFLAGVVARWEEAAKRADAFARVVILRIGVVLGPDGGALDKMRLPFRLGLGGRIAGGRQWMSWIDRHDLISMILWAVANGSVHGIYNATAPEPVRNRDFTRALGKALHRPAIFPAPAPALRLLLGEMASEMLIGGQRVLPVRATSEGFRFEYPSLDASLRHALQSDLHER